MSIWQRRGMGVKHTYHLTGRFVGLWMVATIAAVLVASASTFFWLRELLPDIDHSGTLLTLGLQVAVILLIIVGLGIFTTHRLAGPWIAVRRAVDDVAQGDFSRRLQIRNADSYLREFENAFNQMMETVESRCDGDPKGEEPNGSD